MVPVSDEKLMPTLVGGEHGNQAVAHFLVGKVEAVVPKLFFAKSAEECKRMQKGVSYFR